MTEVYESMVESVVEEPANFPVVESTHPDPRQEMGTTAKPKQDEPEGKAYYGLVGGQHVLKSEQVKMGEKVVIKPHLPQEPEVDPMRVEPIIEGDAIVGMEIFCKCGREHVVRFEFDQSA